MRERRTQDGLGSLALVRPRSAQAAIDAGTAAGAPAADRRAGRRAARLAVARALALPDLGRVVVRRRRGRAPLVLLRRADGRLEPLPVAISLSHRGGRAAAIAARTTDHIGIDLERAGSIPPRLCHYFLAAEERALAARRDPTELWALKEAAWKALRLDDHTPFAALRLHAAADGRVVAVSIRGRVHEVRARVRRPWTGWVLATVRIGRSS